MKKDVFFELKKRLNNEKKRTRELGLLLNKIRNANEEEKAMIKTHIMEIKESVNKENNGISRLLEGLSVKTPLKKIGGKEERTKRKTPSGLKKSLFSFLRPEKSEFKELERGVVKRFGKKEKEEKEGKKKKAKKPSMYINTATRIFGNASKKLIKKDYFRQIRRDLVQANLQIVDTSYISLILMNTLLAVITSVLIFVFLLFFQIGAEFPIITRATDSLDIRLLKTFWVLFVIPLSVFLFTYFYPNLEKKSLKDKIETELPFATIHMASISSSMVNPGKIFEIISATGEYPNLEKEFKKLLNQIHLYGYDLVSALREVSKNTPSDRLKELFNGLAITINSGGDLQEFFDKRAQSLLFEYKIEREKYTKASETFMDIYISVVIAAPMIFMLLIVMMKISGLGISLSTSMITIIMVLSVSMINVIFLTFLHLKQKSK